VLRFREVFGKGIMLKGYTADHFLPEKVHPGERKIKELGILQFDAAILNPGPGFPARLGNQGAEDHQPHILGISDSQTSPHGEGVRSVFKGAEVQIRLDESEAASQVVDRLGIPEFHCGNVKVNRPAGFTIQIHHPGGRGQAVKIGHGFHPLPRGFQARAATPEGNPQRVLRWRVFP